MDQFDLLDDAEEILQPLCICTNQDTSRIGVGHQKGYVIYRVHCKNASSLVRNDGGEGKTPEGGDMTHAAQVLFYTTVEEAFPRRGRSCAASPSGWSMGLPHCNPNENRESPQKEVTPVNQLQNVPAYVIDEPFGSFASHPQASEAHQPQEDGASPTSQHDDIAGNSDHTIAARCAAGNSFPADCKRPQSKCSANEFESYSVVSQDSVDSAPCPIKMGIGHMALLYKTDFVAAVGGGPYPLGPPGTVNLFAKGEILPAASFQVPDPVEALHLDHKLIIVLTSSELRLHCFETKQCLFATSVMIPALTTPPHKPVPAPCADESACGTKCYSAQACTADTFGGALREDEFAPGKVEGHSATCLHSNDNSMLSRTAEVPSLNTTPFVINYNLRCIAFRSCLGGFSLLRYNTANYPGGNVDVETLAVMPTAHKHKLAVLAMSLDHVTSDSASSSTANCTETNEEKRWYVASSSEYATLIRVWLYIERVKNCKGGERETSSQEAEGAEGATPGYFVKIRELRNATLPTPIFHMQFLSSVFLFCVANNKIKFFFIGQQEAAKPYDLAFGRAPRGPCVQNNQSSLHHLGRVSTYFQSEWAACECPLPFSNEAFLPKWVHTVPGMFAYLQRNASCSNAMGSGEWGEANTRSPEEDLSAMPVANAWSLTRTIYHQATPELAAEGRPKATRTVTSSRRLTALWSDMARSYIPSQLSSLVETANLTVKYYLGSTIMDGGVEDASGPWLNKEDVGVDRGGATLHTKSGDAGQWRDYTIKTELASSIVIWWDRPAHWQLERTSNSTTVTSTGIFNGNLWSNYLLGGRGSAVLRCVTCDGSALSLEFNPGADTISCSDVTPVCGPGNWYSL
ncbi:hypothetical protein ERJ75_000876600 [Trypanosoma vivax]|uniref:Uncharacterized protein n=1 Tax=Trypanosoma vivax (strain Y486) TaxID=1055687 RepID=G0TXK8_TRYVY|nr:hypothetical protein TRVL_05076 [Trypanosoma vivax]KAH8612627.1 hypothetical protein ERJ75_000876600 [Trypanosoma vivax]CCC48698.1 conserved hypothetical protein [Trypanosoma vivax Y486]